MIVLATQNIAKFVECSFKIFGAVPVFGYNSTSRWLLGHNSTFRRFFGDYRLSRKRFIVIGREGLFKGDEYRSRWGMYPD